MRLQGRTENLKDHLMCHTDNTHPKVPFAQHCCLSFWLSSTRSSVHFLSLLLLESCSLASSLLPCVCRWQLLKNSSPQGCCHQLRNPGAAVKTQKTKTDSNTKRIRLFYSGRGKGLKSSVSRDAINSEQRGSYSHSLQLWQGWKEQTTEFTTVSRSMELIPVLGKFIH